MNLDVCTMESEVAKRIPPTQSSLSEGRTSRDPEERMSLMVPLSAMCAMKNPIKIEHVSSLENTESTIPVR